MTEKGKKGAAKAKAKEKSQPKGKGNTNASLQALGDQGGSVDDRVHRRCTWLNANVFWEGAIDRSAIEALSTVSFRRAMDMCQDIEEKGSENIGNPSAYLQTAVSHEHRMQAGSGYDAGWHDDWRQPSPVWEWEAKEYMDTTIHKRCTWLNTNVFWEGAITEKVIAALSRLSIRQSLDLLADVENKADRVADPNKFLDKAVRRELPGYDDDYWAYPSGSSGGGGYSRAAASNRYVDDGVHKRCTWLNANVLWPGAIDEDAIASLSTIDYRRAMEMLKDIESRGPNGLTHPSSYITASVRHEHEYLTGSYGDDGSYWAEGANKGYISDVIHRRCTWLNANVFWQGAISEAAVATLSELEVWRALEILQDLEWKAGEVQNPSKWIQGSVANQWPSGSYMDSRIHRRCIWLNANIFWQDAIDEEAIRAISSLDYTRAMELCSELEAKGIEKVSEPARYLKTAVRREYATGGGKGW